MKIKIGDYLIKRLEELNVKEIFGVPGDYNLGFLDLIDDAKGVKWVGNCNELNAAYAADGYARIKGFGAILTTFGVGELSAINGVAGSYTEDVPVLKIVGSPSANVQVNRALVHHSLGEGNFDTFARIFKEVTASQAIITEINAQTEIDRVLTDIYKLKKPGYLVLPVDIVAKEIEVEMKPLDLDVKSNEETLARFIEHVAKLVEKSQSQMILADFQVLRNKCEKELADFINAAKIPATTLSMGKTAIDETNEYFAGVYTGKLSPENVKNVVNKSDLAILVGVKLTDSTTAGFTYMNDDMKLIEISTNMAKIGGKVYTDLVMKDVLEALTKSGIKFSNEVKVQRAAKEKIEVTDVKLTQKRYFDLMQDFLKDGDVLVAEQGTSFFGASELSMPRGASFIGQPLWGSIGYTVGAVLGTHMADRNRRNILLVGDGSFQLTVQEVSTMLRQNLNTVVFVVNNDGYTVERVIHGPRREYNDIKMWDYRKLPEVFAPEKKDEMLVFNVSTEIELAQAMKEIDNNPEKFAFVEVHMGMDDVPQILGDLASLFVSQNGY
ncbi:MAG: alpha-keto acid decarboxylase family protein [Sarcina sp.]